MGDLFSLMRQAALRNQPSRSGTKTLGGPAYSSAGDPSTRLPGSNCTRLLEYVEEKCPLATHAHLGLFGYEALVRDTIAYMRYVNDDSQLQEFPAMISLRRPKKKPLDVYVCPELGDEIVLCISEEPCRKHSKNSR
jgi:hypothetical protein